MGSQYIPYVQNYTSKSWPNVGGPIKTLTHRIRHLEHGQYWCSDSTSKIDSSTILEFMPC